MANPSSNLLWCVVRIAKDSNWWVKKTSDPANWEKHEKLSIIDPLQFAYLLDLLDPLREHGLSHDIVEAAFIPFQIQEKNADRTVRLIRVNELVMESDEKLFVLPDVLGDDKSPYAAFLDHITKLRVQYVNENTNLEQKLTVDEFEATIGESQAQSYDDSKDIHAFLEIADILEYLPDGCEIITGDDGVPVSADAEEDIDTVEGFDDLDVDDKIEADDTMRWGDEDMHDDGGPVDDFGEKRRKH
jgi:hypothetical protein